MKPNQHPDGTIVPVHRKIAGSAEHRQYNDENKGPNQARKKDEASQRRIENDLPAAGFFSRIWFLFHDTASVDIQDLKIPDLEIQDLRDSRFEHFVGSAVRA